VNAHDDALGRKTWRIVRCLAVLAAGLATTLVVASDAWARPAAAPGSLPAAYHQSCLPDGTVRVTFGWTPSYGDSQWLDLSLSDNGFAPGTYVGVGVFGSLTGTFTWDGLTPGRTHFARVNTHIFLAWEPSQTSRFVTRTCARSSAAQLSSASPEQCNAMTFQWAPANPEGLLQWIDLSTANNGFAPGTHAQAGPFSGGVSGFYWPGLRQGTRHYWRVNTWTGSGWISSATGSFSTPPPQLAATADAERILGAAVRAMKGRDLPVFVTERARALPYWVDQAIARGGKAYFGTYDGCSNEIIVVEAAGGDGSLMQFRESMTALPPTLAQVRAQLKQLFPGAGPAFDVGAPEASNTAYLFQHVGDATSSVAIASAGNGSVPVTLIVGSGSYQALVPLFGGP
jgi:hypothetical protein